MSIILNIKIMGDNMPLKIFFTMLSFILGCYTVELNQNNKFKHNILIGTIAYIFLLIIPCLIIFI